MDEKNQQEHWHDTYLDKAQLEEGDISKPILSYLTNVRIVILLIIALVAGGLFSYFSLPRTLNPEVEIPIVFIQTALPGANPSDVESLVTIPIEDEVRGLDGIDVVTSTSTNSSSGITIQFFSDVNPDEAQTDVQNAVNTVTDLPEDATTPVVQKLDFENQPIWTFALISDTDEASLNRYAEELNDKIENLSKVDRVTTRGDETQEIQIEIKAEVINAFGINPQALAQAVRAGVNAHPAGNVETETGTFSLTIDPTVTTVQDLRELHVNINGERYILSELATISERPVPGEMLAYYVEGEKPVRRSVTFDVYRSTSERIDETFADTQNLLDRELARQDGRFEVATVTAIADEIDKQFSSLLRSFTITIALVFAVLFTFFGARQAVIASLAIPLTFMGAFLTMRVFGISINFLSLFSLLLSLGLLVDVMIVILSAITSYYRTGRFTPQEAGLLVWRDFSKTLFITTLTTVWAFTPLLLASGIIGEFIKPIPIVVSSTLLSSLIVGLFIGLPMMMALLVPHVPNRVKILLWLIVGIGVLGFIATIFQGNPLIIPILVGFAILGWILWINRAKLKASWDRFLHENAFGKRILQAAHSVAQDGLLSLETLSEKYKAIIRYILDHPALRKKTVIIVTTFFAFSVALIPAGFVVNEFFPKENQDFIYIDVELPAGTKKSITQFEALTLADQLRDTPELKNMHVQLGIGIGPDGSPGGKSATNYFLITLVLTPEEDRSLTSIEIAQGLRDELENYQKGDASVVELSGGPPAGADVQITLLGEELTQLDDYANQLVERLNEIPGTTNVEKSITTGNAKIVVEPNEALAASQGYLNSDAGLLLRTFANGFELKKDVALDDLSDKRDIVMRLNSEPEELNSIGQLVAPQNPFGASLYTYGDLVLEPNPTQITREEGKRSLSVTATVLDGYSISTINGQLENFAEDLPLPDGYSWKTGGVNEENQESVQSILQAMVLAFVLILATLVIKLGSYRKAVIVLLVIPLALTGVFVIFALTGTPLSFPALIGVLALFGIVVNNSIILVDKINMNLQTGMRMRQAITDAAASRLEPIALSSLTTIIGLMPITLSDPLWRGLGGAIISGLVFSGTIMLFFIPVIYAMWFNDEKEEQRQQQSTLQI